MTADSLANQDAETTELSAELTEVTWQRLTHVKGKGTVEKVLIFIELHTIYIYIYMQWLLFYYYMNIDYCISEFFVTRMFSSVFIQLFFELWVLGSHLLFLHVCSVLCLLCHVCSYAYRFYTVHAFLFFTQTSHDIFNRFEKPATYSCDGCLFAWSPILKMLHQVGLKPLDSWRFPVCGWWQYFVYYPIQNPAACKTVRVTSEGPYN